MKPEGIPLANLIVGVPKETYKGEKRVALTPENAALLLKKGYHFLFLRMCQIHLKNEILLKNLETYNRLFL
jgi:hypothetical protein